MQLTPSPIACVRCPNSVARQGLTGNQPSPVIIISLFRTLNLSERVVDFSQPNKQREDFPHPLQITVVMVLSIHNFSMKRFNLCCFGDSCAK